MTCRHSAGDPSCTTRYGSSYSTPETPDAKNYEIIQAERAGSCLVMKVKYPNCRSCAYEGCKIMVFAGTTEGDALLWKKIDPHFRAPGNKARNEAPSPVARFPGNQAGWQDAIAYARTK